jgi:hypothetical protein
VAGVYKDNESGRKGRAEREAFDRMFTDASKGQFDLVLFWSLDRFSREGISQTIHYLRQLESYDVHFNSYTELSTENELVRSILLSTLAYFRALRVRADLGAHEGWDGADQGAGRTDTPQTCSTGWERRMRKPSWKGKTPFSVRYSPRICGGRMRVIEPVPTVQ